MTWIYIPDDSTFSTVSADTADSVSGFDSPTRTPASGRSPISNGTNTANGSSKPGLRTDSSMTLQYGEETSGSLTADPGVESWISSLRVHHVPVSRSPAAALEERMTEICSRKRSDWLTRYDRATSSWKMSQVSLWEDDPIFGTFSADWPRSGYMNAVGMLYRLKMPRRLTNGPDGGASPVWMTPNTMDSLSAKSQQALDHEHETARPGRSNPNNLRDQVSVSEGHTKWPTPNASDAKGTSLNIDHDVNRGYLRGVVNLLPTPSSGGDSGGDDLVTAVDGSLSPDWVSWLMGIPIAWTSLEPLPREEYDQWLQMQRDGTWWAQWWGPWWFDCPSIATGIPNRANRLKCLGNGIVPASLALFLRGTR
jgi:hypothetical protein